MNLQRLKKELDLNTLAEGGSDADVTGGYASDLLSDVLANAKHGDVWVTNQKHINVIAVASLLGLSGVIIAGGISPDENTVEKAREEEVSLFMSDLPAFEIVGRLYALGVRANGG